MNHAIAIDCMGGDHGPSVTVAAASGFLADHSEANAMLVGKESELTTYVEKLDPAIRQRLHIQHASEVVGMGESPPSALKNKKDSSMRVAINLVKRGEAAGCVSAGNTGALMATARFVLKMLPGIDRPAICAVMPTMRGQVYMLDLGANVDCSAEHLVQFGIMGSVLASALEHRQAPSVGLLNIGEEAIKGNSVVKDAAEGLQNSGVNFLGNVEGDGIFKGHADIVVCDGFVGNVSLKTTEGLAQMINSFLREEFKRGLIARTAALLAMPVLRRFKRRVDHRSFNGAVLLGLRGVVIKSHGSADVYAFQQAITRAYETVRNGVLTRISERLHELHMDEKSSTGEDYGEGESEEAVFVERNA